MQRNWIEKCFSSIRNSSVPVKIIAIDNKSSDNSVEYIQENFPETILLESEKNLGFGGANNIGLKKALDLGGEFFFLLNQDAWVEENTIELLVKNSHKNTKYGILSPLHLNGKGTALDEQFSKYIAPDFCKNLYSDFALNKIENKIYESGFICAAAWLLTKDCLKKVGGFSPTFFHYAEDENYVQRLLYKNLKIGVLPTAKIYHDREERKDWKLVNTERSVARKFSSPNNCLEIDVRIRQLKFKIIKNTILLKSKENKNLKKELTFLIENKEKIQENLKKTISNEKFVFLNE